MSERMARALASIGSMEAALTTHPRDWSLDHRDAWVYGMIVGWGDCLPDVASRHGWSEETQEKLRRGYAALHP